MRAPGASKRTVIRLVSACAQKLVTQSSDDTISGRVLTILKRNIAFLGFNQALPNLKTQALLATKNAQMVVRDFQLAIPRIRLVQKSTLFDCDCRSTGRISIFDG